MAIEFKKLAEVNAAEALESADKVLIERDGEVMRAPAPEMPEIPEGLPEGAAANQVLVTDAEGAVKWEDKAFFEAQVTVNMFTEEVLEFTGNNKNVSGLWSDVPFKVGSTYSVIFDGVEYNLVAQGNYDIDTYTDIIYVGNAKYFNELNLQDPIVDTGEPFVISEAEINCESGTHTVSMYTEVSVLKPIDFKFLPATVPEKVVFKSTSTWDDDLGTNVETWSCSHDYTTLWYLMAKAPFVVVNKGGVNHYATTAYRSMDIVRVYYYEYATGKILTYSSDGTITIADRSS